MIGQRVRLLAMAMAACAAGLCLAGPGARAWAGAEQAGTTVANFLSLQSGVREAALGGASLGWSEDLGAAGNNPAALGWVDRLQFAAAHAPLGEGTSQEWLALGGRFGNLGLHYGFSAVYHSLGDFEGRDALNQPTGSFGASDMALGLHLAQVVGDRAAIGLTLKHVSEDLSSVKGSGFTFDVGGQLRAGPVGVGLAAQNVAGSMSYSGATYPFPSNVGAGVSVALPLSGTRVVLDGNLPRAYHPDVRAGVEWSYLQTVSLRLGYRRELGGDANEPLNGPSFGLGAGINGMWLDYAFDPGPSENEQRISLRFSPGSWNPARGAMGFTGSQASEAPRPVAPPKTEAPPKPKAEPAPRIEEKRPAPAPVQSAPAVKPPAETPAPAPAAVTSAPERAPQPPPKLEEREPAAPAARTDAEPKPAQVKDSEPGKGSAPEKAKVSDSKKEQAEKAPPKAKPARKPKKGDKYTESEREAARRAGIRLPGEKK